MSHQNKPTAPITYLNKKGKTVDVTDWPELSVACLFPHFTIQELSLIQTLSNRSLLNCNCNLAKKVMKSIVDKVNQSVWRVAEEYEDE